MQGQQTERPRLLRIKAAAQYLSLSPWSLRRIIAQGDLPVVKIGDHAAWLLDVKDLDKWIETSKEVL